MVTFMLRNEGQELLIGGGKNILDKRYSMGKSPEVAKRLGSGGRSVVGQEESEAERWAEAITRVCNGKHRV